MEGQWPQQNSAVHTELDLSIASSGDFNLLLQELGDDLDGLLGLGANTNDLGNTGDASAAAAAAADQDKNRGETHSDQSTAARPRHSRRRHHREHVYHLEVAFRANPHPDENERADLGRRLGITRQQVKFWFQNRRSAQKTHEQKQELRALQGVNEALQDERRALRWAAENNACLSCSMPPTVRVGETRQHLLSENARLKEELRRANALLKTLPGGRAEAMPVAMPCGSHGPATNHDVGAGKALATEHAPSRRARTRPMMPANEGFVRSERDTKDMLIDIAARAAREFRTLVYSGTQLWMPTPDGEVEFLNLQTYVDTMFPSIFGPYRTGCVVDGTRKTGDVLCTADKLVEVLMDAAEWSGMFPGIVGSATASHIFTPSSDSRHEMIILMDAELRVLSPGMLVRRIKFMRQCREVEPGTWAVVDASVDGILGQDGSGAPPTYTASRLLPSGCLIEGKSNGCCKVTWIVNMEHDKTTVSLTYNPLFRSGQALGACRWLASLQRQCEYLAIVHSLRDTGDMTPNGRMNIFEVAQRMTRSFYQAMCGPWSQPWRTVDKWNGGCGCGVERFVVVARIGTYSAGSGAPGEKAGAVVLSATAPVWLPGIPAQQVFDYLCDGDRRGEWDSLANGAAVLQEGYFATGQLPGNAVSVLRTMASDVTNSKVILQETYVEASCMVLAYATMDEEAMHHDINNGVPAASLSLLPSGLVILPDGASPISTARSSSTAVGDRSNVGSIVSVMYQTLLNGQPPENSSYEAIDNAGNLLCRVIRKIKDAVRANNVVPA